MGTTSSAAFVFVAVDFGVDQFSLEGLEVFIRDC
jgi:hypothetical protein